MGFFFYEQHLPTCFYNGHWLCYLWGRNYIVLLVRWSCVTATAWVEAGSVRMGFVVDRGALRQSKVKCTPVQALRLCTGRTAHRGSRGIALPFHNHGTRRGWRVSVMPGPLFTPAKDQLHRRLGGPQGQSGQGLEISPPTGIPAHSQSLYRLCHPAHALWQVSL